MTRTQDLAAEAEWCRTQFHSALIGVEVKRRWIRPEGPHAEAVRESVAWLISEGERHLAERLDWHMGKKYLRSNPVDAVEEIQAAIDKLTLLHEKWSVDQGNGLFVALHATIDVQLDILHATTEYYRAGMAFLTQADPFIEHGLAIARAINKVA